MDEYRALEALEDQCMPHTDPDSEEFSFKQQELHATFVRLLESYVEAYIRSLGRTLADFYEALRELKDGSGAPMLDASDCLDTLYEMEDIRCWIDGVKARVRHARLHGVPGKLIAHFTPTSSASPAAARTCRAPPGSRGARPPSLQMIVELRRHRRRRARVAPAVDPLADVQARLAALDRALQRRSQLQRQPRRPASTASAPRGRPRSSSATSSAPLQKRRRRAAAPSGPRRASPPKRVAGPVDRREAQQVVPH